MSLQEVKNLRNQTRYEDATRLSRADLEANPSDIWMKRSHAWSLYYMIKKHVQAGQSEQAKTFYTEFESLQMPADETLIYERMGYFKQVLSANYISSRQLIQEGRFEEAFDLHAADEEAKSEQLAWALYYLLRSTNKSKNPDQQVVLSRLELFKQKVTPQRQLVYKLLLQELIKLPPNFWDRSPLTPWLEFLGLFEALDEEDFEKQEYEGKKLISIAERLHIGYSKALIREKATKHKVEHYIKEVIEPKLESRRGMLYVPYFKAKLLLEIGDRKEGMQAFLPFARKKQGEFWVWQVFAEYHQQDPELYLSCLCKAMTCKAKPEFLSGIKERLLTHLIATRQYDWAKTELTQLLKLREKHDWGLRALHRTLLTSDWYRAANEVTSVIPYSRHCSLADQILGPSSYADINTEILVLVDYVNTEKKVFNFITSDKKKSFGKYNVVPELGEIYRLKGNSSADGYYKVESLQKTEDPEGSMKNFRKKVSGNLRKSAGQPFGFISGVFVSPVMIKEFQLAENDLLEGVAIYGPVKGKEEWAWRLIKIVGRE